VCPNVGIGGHAAHGGHGHTSRAWGLLCDRVIGHEVVLADGTIAHASATENNDLFWALRGAAPSFGIITVSTCPNV
jgi:FAD/FMN-containing dehydrogenase